MVIGEINLGDVNGEEESRDSNFMNNYYVREKIIKKSLDPSVCVILGRQGSGKTVLSHYIVKKYGDYQGFIKRVSFGDLTTSTLAPKNIQVAETDYFHLFEWTFLIELSKLILTDRSINDEKSTSLKAMLKYVTQTFSIHKKSINQILTSGVEITSPFGGLKLNKNIDIHNLPIITEELKIIIATLLKNSKNRFILYLDDIDDHITVANKTGISIIKGMVNAVYKLNFFIRDNNPKSKITLLLRNDMFFKLNGTIINKIRESHSVSLNWSRNFKWNNSDLAHMIAQKIRNSNLKEYKKWNDIKILTNFFPTKVRETFTGTFILSRTFFRPREVVQFLTIAQNKFPDEEKFTSPSIFHSERAYSNWLKKEIEAEMYSHFEYEEIFELFNLLTTFNKKMFNYLQLKNFLEDKNIELNYFSIEKALKVFFRFGVLRQSYKMDKGRRKKRYYIHNFDYGGQFKNEHPNFLKNDFHLHFGLYKSILTSNTE
ncbi:MAG: P-loop ATPase, Sll1717 family [Flavobacteriaceae bacterium]|jgi:hypothetical protein